MSEMTLPATLYKGLMPYSEEDAPFFFGREAETEIITANLMASRLTLLYGASGVGKTSVLRAGVAYGLRQQAQQNLAERGSPEFAVVVFGSWRDDPIVGLTDRVRNSVAQISETRFLGENGFLGPSSRSLAQTLQAWTERVGGDLLIILDQFEEYFLYHAQEDGEGTFAVEFPRAVNRPDLRVNFLISIREDSLAKLDRFKGHIPNLFDNYLRVEHLDREAARAAVEKPIEKYNSLCAADDQKVSIEPALVEAVLDQVKTGQVVLGESGRGVVRGKAAKEQIETPYLQLVVARLWEEEMRAGSRVLRLETLNRLGGAERIVHTHLDAAMSALPPNEQDVAARVFHYLVTPSGTKITHTVHDLTKYAELPEMQLTRVLDKLSGAEIRILRPVAPSPEQPTVMRYEIFHDVLAPAILDWRERYLRQVRTRRLQAAGIALGIVVLVLIAGLWANARQAQRQAQQQAQQALQVSQNLLQVLPTSGGTAEPSVVAMRMTAEAVGTSAAQVLQATTPTYTPTTTPLPVPTATPTPIVVPKPNSVPTNTPTQPSPPLPTPTAVVYPVPVLVSPYDGAMASGQTTFVWSWTGPALPANQGFELRIWKEGQPDHYGAASPVRTTSVTLDMQGAYSVQQGGSGRYFWTVAVVQLEPYYRLGSEAVPRTLEVNFVRPPVSPPLP
jgi:hypothetical protein